MTEQGSVQRQASRFFRYETLGLLNEALSSFFRRYWILSDRLRRRGEVSPSPTAAQCHQACIRLTDEPRKAYTPARRGGIPLVERGAAVRGIASGAARCTAKDGSANRTRVVSTCGTAAGALSGRCGAQVDRRSGSVGCRGVGAHHGTA